MQVQAPAGLQQSPQSKFFQQPRFGGGTYQKTNNFFNSQQYRQHSSQNVQQGVEFDGKRLRKAVIRKTIDYNAAIVRQLELRIWQRDHRDFRAIQPDAAYYPDMIPPPYFVHNPINAVTTKFVRTSTNKMRCPIFCVAWTPEGRRLVTGASSGEFTLWNGLTFNFETILQAHDSPVRCMVWSHNDLWMVTGDHAGFVKYWQSNMNNVKMFQAHKEPLRGISFCPTDHKFATCSDDGTVRIWDFLKCHEEKILRGHGADVKCVAWHPHKGLLVSGSKDSQQPIKLWDPKSGQSLATLHAHKSTVMEAKWNHNGNWLLTGSRDHLIKLFDIRKLSQEVQTFRGHKKEVTSLAWHPVHESLFASGGSDGAVMFWLNGVDKEVGSMEQAHDSIVWSLAWHPLGHILCTGSNDHTCKFWTRNRPGDKMRDKYNLNTLTTGNSDEAAEYDDVSTSLSIPGMGLDQQHVLAREMDQSDSDLEIPSIPGLDFGNEEPQMPTDNKLPLQKKVPYAKPIPRQFQQQWMDNRRPLLVAPMGNQSNAAPPGNEGLQGGMMNPQQHGGVAPSQGFSPRMMAPGDQQGGSRMPVGNAVWSPPNQGPDGQIGGRFSVGNGNQFHSPGGPGFSEGNTSNQSGQQGNFNKFIQEKPEPSSWKEYGDSDLRIPMDSDLRMQNQGHDDRRREGRDFADNGGSGGGRDSTRLRGDARDQDMRPHSKDTDSRSLDYNNHSKPNSEENAKSGSGRVRVSRWSSAPPVRGAMAPFSGAAMPQQGGNFGSNEPKRRDGDWDERMTQGRMGPANDGDHGGGGSNFSSPRKRGWDDGPGSGGSGRESYDHVDNSKRNDNFSGPGFLQQPQNMGNQGPGRGMQSWGSNRGGRNDMRSGRGGRGPAFRGSGGRGGMWGHN